MTLDDMVHKYLNLPSPLELISDNYLNEGIELFFKRDDLIHPWICGNKWRKLQYNINHNLSRTEHIFLTFGGTFSNHLVALAAISYYLNVPSIGIVRSYKPDETNPTIRLLRSFQMELIFVLPSEYEILKNDLNALQDLTGQKQLVVIPEGGTNHLATLGVRHIYNEIILQHPEAFDIVAVCTGTGGTAAGLSQTIPDSTCLWVLSPFKSDITSVEGMNWIDQSKEIIWHNISGKVKFGHHQEGIGAYINQFYEKYNILLDPIYTARAMRFIDRLIMNQELNYGTRLLFIHTGGLQGILGHNYLYGEKDPISIPADYTWLTNPSITFG